MAYRLISADDHLDLSNLPRDLWTSRAPKAFADIAPRVVETDKGPTWVCDGENWGTWGPRISPITGLIVRPGQGRRRRDAESEDVPMPRLYEGGEIRPTSPELRLADMDRDGVHSSVMYGPITALSVENPELRQWTYQAYNDWLAEEFCAYDPNRLIGSAQMPLDPAGAAAELERVAKIGLKTVNILAARVSTPLYDREWDRVWDIAEETGIPIGCHITADIVKSQTAPVKPTAASALTRISGALQMIDPFGGMIAHGVMERHPKLKMVMAETGLSWVPYIIQRMDYRWAQVQNEKAHWEANGGIPISMPPSEYWRRQVWVTFQEDNIGLELIDYIGEDQVMWGSDYPHPDSTWPSSQVIIAEDMANVDEKVKKKILHDNAKKLYNLDID